MMLLLGLHKLADVIFGITKNRFILHHQNWSGKTSVIDKFF